MQDLLNAMAGGPPGTDASGNPILKDVSACLAICIPLMLLP